MISSSINQFKLLLTTSLFFLLISISQAVFSQQQIIPEGKQEFRLKSAIGHSLTKDLFGRQSRFIQNIGQYNDTILCHGDIGTVLYGYEGLPMPVLFTAKGTIHIQRKQRYLTYEERANLIAHGVSKEERKKLTGPIDRSISFEWLNSNPQAEVIAIDKTEDYHTYGLLTQKAFGYKKIIYRNLYPGVDAEYSFTGAEKPGYEYRLLVKRGADISKIKIKIGGNVKSISTDENGNLVVKSDIDGIVQSLPLCFFAGENLKADKHKASYKITNNEISFDLPNGFTKEKEFVIDPFVSSTATLSGMEAGEAKDIDFDYAGNVFVSGGGDGSMQKLAKYSPTGALLWTFSGQLTTPTWNFGGSYGGWVVEKSSGAIYLGQGLASGGFTVVRLNSVGLYDNYITTPNSNFAENWKMIYSCSGGIPGILIAGGGGNANNELAILNPATTNPTTSNLSGLSGGHNDISDVVIDPITNQMYTIYSTPVTDATRDNLIFKHAPPYNSITMLWQSNSGGLRVLREPVNRPYMNGLDNSSNMLAVNSNYLFYWDGKNLKAYSKATGAAAGNVFTIATNIALWQGGIFADECNNVFIGNNNATIKVLKFDGTNFNDAAAVDITLSSFTGNVYDITYDNGQQLLYACGNGFVASVDINAYCPAAIYNLTITENCPARSIQASLTPAPPAGTTIEYELHQGNTLIATNSTGFFNGLIIGESYTVKVFLNRQCGGTHSQVNFIFNNTNLLLVNSPAAVCPQIFVDITAPSITAGTVPGFTLSYWLDIAGTIPVPNPAAVLPGTYYIKATATPPNGCYFLKKLVVPSKPPPLPDAGVDTTICFGKSVQLSGANGVRYFWSPATWLDDPNAQNPVVVNPSPGTYTYLLNAEDINGCRSVIPDTVIVKVNPPLQIGLTRDTVVAINQQLQLNAIDFQNNGFVSYTWTPVFGLSDPLIPNPIAVLDRDMVYQVVASTADDCRGAASINVKVYLGPEIYVASAFTPNNDGLNDVIKALPVGMKEFHYFKIFNRWGQLVFSTSNSNRGWDGKISGMEQATGTFAWIAEAVDFKGNIVRRKGTITLIR